MYISRTRLAQIIIGLLVLTIAQGAGSMAYTAHSQRQADARWCPLLIIADNPRVQRRPQNADEKKAREYLHQLRLELGCDK